MISAFSPARVLPKDDVTHRKKADDAAQNN